GGQQFGTRTTVRKAGIDQVAAEMGNCCLAASEHSVESQLLYFADRIHPIAENLAVVEVRCVHRVAGMAQPFSPLQHARPKSIRGMKQDNFPSTHSMLPSRLGRRLARKATANIAERIVKYSTQDVGDRCDSQGRG